MLFIINEVINQKHYVLSWIIQQMCSSIGGIMYIVVFQLEEWVS